jgi:hypothetical protein
LVLELGDVRAGARELARLLVAYLRHSDLLTNEIQSRAREAVALVQHLVGEGLLASLERAQPDRLGCDGTARSANLADDLDILLADPLRKRDSLEQVLEAGRLEHNGYQVRTI